MVRAGVECGSGAEFFVEREKKEGGEFACQRCKRERNP